MGTMTPRELLRLYTLEQITLEQTLGHILQNLVMLHEEIEALSKLRFDMERLMAFVGMEPETKPKKKEKRRDQDQTEDEKNL